MGFGGIPPHLAGVVADATYVVTLLNSTKSLACLNSAHSNGFEERLIMRRFIDLRSPV